MFFRFPPMGKFNKTRFERNWTTFVNPAFSAAWKSPPKMVALNRNFKIRSQGCFFVSPPMGKFNKTHFERDWTTFVNPAFSAAWKSPPKMVAWNRNFKIRSQGCFFVSPPMGKFNKTRFERDWTTFVNAGFSAAWKKPPKMVAWNRNFKIRSQGCFFVSPRWGNFGQTKKTAVRSNFTISFSCHHFVWAFPSSGKSRVDEGRPVAFKTRFFNFPHRGEA